jgi:MFS family permease
MGGFAIIYMQFYETLPNFIYDWVDTSQVAKSLNLPDYMLMTTSLGTMIDFKWLYTLNSSFIVLGVVTVSWLMSGVKLRYAIMFGISTASIGLFVSGATQVGSMAVFGMLIYTLGEMITNPRYLEYMASLGTKSRRSVYLGYLNISFAIGLAGGSLLGGYLYNEYSEKSTLAMRYLESQQVDMTTITHSNAMDSLVNFTETSIQESTTLLWDLYSPNRIWYIFLGLGFFSTLLIYLHSRVYHNKQLK